MCPSSPSASPALPTLDSTWDLSPPELGEKTSYCFKPPTGVTLLQRPQETHTELGEDTFCCLKPPVCITLLQWPQEMNTAGL